MRADSINMVKEVGPPASVAVGTLGGGILTVLQYLPILLGCLATLAGTVLSIVLTLKAIGDIRENKKLRQAEIKDIKFRQENDLPCRRCTDKAGCKQ